MYQDQPQDYVHSLFDQVMWPAHPLGRDIVGTVESLQAMSREDLIGYIKGHYLGANLVVAVAGSIEDGFARDLIENRLSLPGAGTEDGFAPAPPSLTKATVRERRALAYDVHSFASLHRDAGCFGVYMGVDANKAQEALEAALEELRKIVEEEVEETELTKVKEFRKGNLRLSLESTSSMAHWLGHHQLLTGRVKTVEEVIGIIDAITPAEIRRVATVVLKAPIQMAVIGPFESDDLFRAAIGA
jgi:predicted Zn-dependent peptidase